MQLNGHYYICNTTQGNYRHYMTATDSLYPHQTGVVIRNTIEEDIPKIVNLQRESFPYLARYGNVWHPDDLEATFMSSQRDNSLLWNLMIL